MTKPSSYKRHRFPPQIIAHAVWLYFRFPLSLRLVEEMLLERGIVVSYEGVVTVTGTGPIEAIMAVL
jgi:putative transposase